MTPYEIICRDVAKTHEFAVEAFKDHEVTEELAQGVYRHYVCSRPKSSIYRFNVVTYPGMLVVSGDIGEMMWSRCEDMFQWAPGAINSIDYFEEKVPPHIEAREFSKEIAEATLDELLKDEDLSSGERIQVEEKIGDCKWHLDDGEHLFCNEVYRSGLFEGSDFPDFTTFNSTFLWCREALLWFFERQGMMR